MSVIRCQQLGRACVLAGVVAVQTALSSSALGQTTAGAPLTPSAAESTNYRRVFVPADRPEQWPTNGQRYLPVDRAEFERLIKRADDSRELAELGGVQLVSSRYTAELDEQSSLVGQAAFEVKLADRSPRVLKLSSLNVAVTGAHWTGADANTTPAVVGIWDRPGADVGEYGVLVERSGELLLDWSARSLTGGGTDLEYLLQLPAAVQREFVIELPADQTPSMSPGRLAERRPLDNATRTRWTFQLSPATAHRLQIRRLADAAPRESSLPLAAIAEAYGLTPQGLDYEAELRVQLRAAAASELRMAVPASLQVTGVLIDRAAVDFQQDEQDVDTLIIPLPKSAAPITVTIRGVGAIVFDKPWKLPSVAALNAFWTEGTSTLWIDPALELQSITPRAGSLLNSVGVGRTEGGEAHRLQAWSSDASTEVIVAERMPRLHVESVAVAEFADRELAGRCYARLWTAEGPILNVTAALQPDWNLESVEATPVDALAQWHVSGEGPQRRLHVQLRRSPTELAPVQLAISARKSLRAWTPAAKLRELDWIRFADVDAASAHLLVRDRRGDELIAEPSAAEGIVPLESLPAAQRELLGEPLTGLLFAAGRMEHDATIRAASAPPRFQGEAWMELTRTDVGFEHSAEIVCRPTTGAVSELMVNAARALPADAQWTLLDSDMQLVVEPAGAVPSQPAGSSATAPAKMQQYRVRFPQPLSAEFQLRATWRGEAIAADSVNSLTLPGAENWQSWAILRGNPAVVQLDARGCVPAAAVPEARDRPDAHGVIGCYRLGDDPSTPLALTPILTSIAAQADGASGDATCWLCEVTTLQFVDGNQSDRLAYHLEVHDADAVELALPTGYDVVSARVDNEVVVVEPRAPGLNRVRIPLPGDRRTMTLTVDLHGRRRRLDSAERIAPPLPETSFPVLRGRWTVSAPAPFTVESESQRHANAGWRQRLFGPLAGESQVSAGGPLRFGAALGASPRAVRGDQGASAALHSFSIPQGWSVAMQEFVTAPLPMELRRIDDSRALWHVIWLVSVVAAARLWLARPRWVATIAAIAAIGCLTLSVAWIVVPQAVLLGAIAGALVRELMIRTSRPDSSQWSTRSRVTTVVTSLLVAVASANATVHAAETVSPPHGVLYPIDAEGKPAGSDVYAPASLLAELLPSVHKSRYDGAEGALVAATYQLNLVQDAARSEVGCDGARLRFRWRTFMRNASILLPLDRNQADWLAAEHTLDGSPAALRWNEAGDACSVAVAEPGDHELQLKLVPRWTPVASQNQLSLHVPPMPGARVEVTHPAGLQGLMINARSVAASADQPTRTIASIAGADDLELTWPKRLRSAANGVSVDQLTWLEVDPAAARVDVQLRLTGDASSLETLELATSPQLALLPLSNDSPVQEVQSFPGSPTVTELKFKAPPQLPATISLQFQVQRSVSLGRITFPSVRVLGVQTANHYFAASIDPRLRGREESPVGMTPAPVAEVERVWGPLPATPAWQYAVAAGEPNWSMHVEPLPSRFTPRERLDVLCTADDAEVAYAAAISDIEGDILVYRLAVPPTLAVDDVNVLLDNRQSEATVRWSRPRPNLLCVFLSRPLNEPHTLQVSGRSPYADGRRLPVPRMGLESTRTNIISLGVRRTSDVLVAWSDDAEAPPPATTAMASVRAARLLVGEYAVARNAEATPELEITTNAARLSADALLTLNLASVEPAGSLLLHGRVTRGIVDRVRLVAGQNWRGPFIAEPSAVVVAGTSSGDAGQQVIEVRLEKPIAAGDDVTLKLTGPVALETDQRVRFPQVRVLDASEQRTFLVLPKTPKNQTAEWTLHGLERQPLPASLAEAAGLPADTAAYRIQRSRFVAEQRVFPEALRTAAVQLAETRLALDASGEWSAATRLIVQPGGASDLAVTMPAGAELIHAAVDDRSIVRPVLKKSQWQPPAGPRYLPRVFTIGYRGRREDANRKFEFQVPQVAVDGQPLAVNRSLWQVEGEPAANLRASDGALALTERGFSGAARRAEIAAVVDASPLALQLPEWELRQWFQPWVSRLGAASGDAAATSGGAQEAAWGKLQERIAAFAEPDGAERGSVVMRPDAGFHEPLSSACFQGSPGGKLTLTSASTGLGLGRWILAVAIAGTWGMAWRYPVQRESVLGAIERWPAALGVVAGLAWWTLLTPALLGPAIIAFSLAGLFKARQRRPKNAAREAEQHDESPEQEANAVIGGSPS